MTQTHFLSHFYLDPRQQAWPLTVTLFCQGETFLHIYCFLSACFSRNTFADFRLFFSSFPLLKMSSFVIISFKLNFLISIPVVGRFSQFSCCAFITAYYFRQDRGKQIPSTSLQRPLYFVGWRLKNCGYSVRNSLYVTLLVPRIFR